jgi:hypothetical protein
MQNIQAKLDTITQTNGGHQVRKLKYMDVRGMQYIVGDLLKKGTDKWILYEVWDMQGKWWHNSLEFNIKL